MSNRKEILIDKLNSDMKILESGLDSLKRNNNFEESFLTLLIEITNNRIHFIKDQIEELSNPIEKLTKHNERHYGC